MKHTVTRRDLMAAIPVVALGALLFVLPPAAEQPIDGSGASAASSSVITP